jgi:lipoprotein NlpI
MHRLCCAAVTILGLSSLCGGLSADEPLSAEERAQLARRLDREIARLSEALAANPDDRTAQRLYSQRGDAYFFRARFPEALADYEQLSRLNPELEPFHWRRGLAYYYTGRYADAARQFERYFEHDQSDRENGIWRFYAQAREHGLEAARRTMLPYEKPDRALLPEVYRLCAGTLSAAELEQKINAEDVPEAERQARQFYGNLYLGLDYVLKGETEPARRHLARAVASRWPQQAGYGPQYMWHVARLELERLPAPQPR